MIFYKITHNQEIIDVNTSLNINYVKYDRYHQSLKICKNDDPNILGIVSSDNATVYHLIDCPVIPDVIIGEFIDVRMTAISEEDYIVFKKAIDEQREIIDPDPFIPPEPEPTPEDKEKEEEYKRSLQFVKDSKIAYMSYLCNQTIEKGISVTLSDGEVHSFALTEHDQTNLMGRLTQLNAGALQVSYHPDDGICIYYSAEDMMKIIQTSMFHVDFQNTYFNSLKHYINSMNNLVDVSAVYYGMEIPEEYQSQPLKDLLAKMENQIEKPQEQNNEESNT